MEEDTLKINSKSVLLFSLSDMVEAFFGNVKTGIVISSLKQHIETDRNSVSAPKLT